MHDVKFKWVVLAVYSMFRRRVEMELKGLKQTFTIIIEKYFKSACFICRETCRFCSIVDDIVITILVSLTFELKFVSYNQTSVFQVDRTLIQTSFAQWEINRPVFPLLLVIPSFSSSVVVVFFLRNFNHGCRNYDLGSNWIIP